MQTKGVVVAGLGGGSGKSVIAVGIVASLVRQGKIVVPFKKGPDYIDAGWLALAAKKTCFNLDPYLMDEDVLLRSFYQHCCTCDIALVEGNRGLYDGVDVRGGYSTAELALLLGLPVILVVNCAKVTRTVAALVLGCKLMDSRIDIRGVILNNVATERQKKLITEAVEKITEIPVIGVIPRLHKDIFPMRHLGMIPYQEYMESEAAVSSLCSLMRASLDFSLLNRCCAELKIDHPQTLPDTGVQMRPWLKRERVRIGVIRDSAFQFYYPGNFEALEKEGAQLLEIDSLRDDMLPSLDGLYIGGGFPETNAAALAANISFRNSVKEAADAGLPIYAECGGLIYLGESLEVKGVQYPMSGVFPVQFGMEERPQAHGYSIFKVLRDTPFYKKGDCIKGHEFRYSKILHWTGKVEALALQMERGKGFIDKRDGLIYKNVFALYTHVHSYGTPQWAVGFVAACRREMTRREAKAREVCF